MTEPTLQLKAILWKLRYDINNNLDTSNYVGYEDDESFDQAETAITKLIIQSRIDEVKNHPRKSDNRWRDNRLAELQKELEQL